ncbi:hypothetical protein [Arthrobacter sp. NPDC080082]|uniref:hypothetical protein n=1 Tax=unclassified Arthrobacter TaxID=235627 RepID=UPI00342125F3
MNDLNNRLRNARPGLSPVALIEVAVPVTMLRLVVNAQRKKQIALLHEIILRSVDAGLTATDEIAHLTGLENRVISETVAELAVSGHVTTSSSSAIRLTPIGRMLADELTLVTPSVETLNLSFDRLTWKVAAYRSGRLINRRDTVARGVTRIPASQTRRIERPDVTVRDLRALLSRSNERNVEVDYLGIVDLRSRASKYYEAELILYADKSGQTLEAAFLIDDDPSEEHDLAFLAGGGLKSLKVEVEPTYSESGAMPANEGVGELTAFEYAGMLYKSLRDAKEIIIVIEKLNDCAAMRQLLTMLTDQLARGCSVLIGILKTEGEDLIPKGLQELIRPLASEGAVRVLDVDQYATVANGIYLDEIRMPWIPEAVDHQHLPEIRLYRIQPTRDYSSRDAVRKTVQNALRLS